MPGTRVLKDGCSFWPRVNAPGLAWWKQGVAEQEGWVWTLRQGTLVQERIIGCTCPGIPQPGPAAPSSWDSVVISAAGGHRYLWGTRYLPFFSPSETDRRGRFRVSCGARPHGCLSDLRSAKVQAPWNLRSVSGCRGVPSPGCYRVLSTCWGRAPPSGHFLHDWHNGCGWCLLVHPPSPQVWGSLPQIHIFLGARRRVLLPTLSLTRRVTLATFYRTEPQGQPEKRAWGLPRKAEFQKDPFLGLTLVICEMRKVMLAS